MIDLYSQKARRRVKKVDESPVSTDAITKDIDKHDMVITKEIDRQDAITKELVNHDMIITDTLDDSVTVILPKQEATRCSKDDEYNE